MMADDLDLDLDLKMAMALAESDEACSDDDYRPSDEEVELNEQLDLNSFRVSKKQKQRKKKLNKKGDKVYSVAQDSSGDRGRQEKARNQAANKDVFAKGDSTASENVRRTTSISMAELDSFRCTGGARDGTRALLESFPVMENDELDCVEISSTAWDSFAEIKGRSGPAADHADEFLVIDIDTDEVVGISDETQFNVLLSLCGEECEEAEIKINAPDGNRVPTLGDGKEVNPTSHSAQPPNFEANRVAGSGLVSGEGLGAAVVDVVLTKIEGAVLEGPISRELLMESGYAPDTDSDDEADHPVVQERKVDEEGENSQDEFGDDFISSMRTQKCVSQPDEVKAPHRMPPSPLKNISNLPCRADTNRQRLNVKSANQAASRVESKCLSKEETEQLKAGIQQVHQGSSADDGRNKENVGVSPSGVVLGESPLVSGNGVEGSAFREGRVTGREDVLVDGGGVEAAIRCPICGEDISGISVEERVAHTNFCLDKLGANEGPPAEEGSTGRPASNLVKDWLEKLNLSRYVSAFVEQEIDWDTIPWLTEEDLVIMGITAIGPRRKIFQAIQELKRGISGGRTEPRNVRGGPSPATVNSILPAESISRIPQANGEESNNVITNYFPLPPDAGRRHVHEAAAVDTARRTGVVKSKSSKRPRSSAYQSRSGIPAWMSIPGTPFRVDAFQHLSGDCSYWFLTHFHTDHYQGLTRGFRYGHIFCSSITARLINLRIGVSWEKIMIIPLDEKVKIAGVDVTFIDANHCPGSVMILFEPPDGEAVLHTGDFRFCREMADNSLFQTVNIHTLVLDTTYCDPQYDFPTQDTVIRFVIDAIQAEMFNSDTLFLIGTYTIGKERIFLEVAKVLKKYVYIGAPKKKLLDCMDISAEDTKWLTCKEHESFIHVVPLWSISSFKRMNSIARHYQGRYKLIVAFSPTGWSFGRGKKKSPGKRWKQGTMIRYEVPYSEHCSFSELREFLKFIGPEDIIPSVPNKNVGPDAMIASLLSEEQ